MPCCRVIKVSFVCLDVLVAEVMVDAEEADDLFVRLNEG